MNSSDLKQEVYRFSKDKSGKNFYRLTLEIYGGVTYLNLRQCFVTDTGLEQATKKGLTLSVNFLTELKLGVDAALEAHSKALESVKCRMSVGGGEK